MSQLLLRCFCFLWCLIGIRVAAHAQSNSIVVIQPPNNGVCGGTAILVPIATTGTFGADNVFTMQLVGGNATTPTYQDLPTKGTGTSLEIILPDTIAPNAYRLRVLASSPKTTGLPSNYFYPQRKPTARIVERPLTVSPYESAGIPIQLSGSDITAYYPYRVTINDSIVVKGPGFTAYPGNKTTTYRITKVENGCGEGTSSGQQTVVVAPFGLQLTSIAQETTCPGATIQVGFSANGTFDSGNRFTVQVTNEKGDYVDLPTKGDRSPLEITLPASVPEGWGNYVRLVSTAPALVSNPIGGLYNSRALGVYPVPSATLETDVKAIRFGETATLTVRLKGHNVQATMSEGTQLEYKPGSYQPVPGQYQVVVKPDVSTTYTIRAATGTCGPVTTSGTVRVEVTNGIIAGKLPDERPCIGQVIRVPIQTNAQFTAQTTFQIQIGGSILLPAVLQKDTVVATLTSQTLSPGLDGTYYSGTAEVRIITQNPAIISTASPSRFEIGYVPVLANINVFTQNSTGNWNVEFPPTLTKPVPVRIMADAKSNLPITISLTDGTRQWRFLAPSILNYSDYPYIVLGDQPTQTTTYSLSEVSNKCGTRRFSDKSKQVIVKQAENRQVLVDELSDRIFCSGESISIPFQTTGTIADSIRYRVRLYGYSVYGYSSFAPVIVGRALKSPITAVLPDVPAGRYTLRIEAENDPLTSRDLVLIIHKKPVATILPTTAQLVVGESTTLLVEANGGGPYSLLTAEGESYQIPDYDANSSTLNGRAYIPIKPDKTTTYRMKSIYSTCGTTAITDERTINVVPYRLYITIPSIPDSYASSTLEQKSATCRGGLLTVPYATIGSVPTDEIFELQISKGDNTPFETMVLTSTANPLIGRLPDSFTYDPYGYYKVRVVGRKTGIVSQTSAGFRVGDLPKAVLSIGPNSSTIADPLVSILVSVTNTYNSTTYGIRNYEPDYSGTYADVISYPEGLVYNLLPRHKTTYSLAFVRNGCGYGTVSGEVTATVKPTLSITSPTPGLQQLICAGKPLTVAYKTTGDWVNGINIVAELVGTVNGSSYNRELSRATTSQGTLALTLPADLVPGDYLLQLRSANPALSTSLSLRIAVPVTVQLTGNLVINAGQKVVVKPVVSGTFPVNYSLSNGAVGIWQTAPPAIELAPSQSGTYTLASVSNVCGLGSFSGSITISFNPASAKFITTDRVSGRLCGGDTVQVEYTGVGLTNSPLTVQLSDRNGDQYASVPTLGQVSPLRVVLPTGLPAGINYRFRVTSSDPTIASSVLLSPVTILEKATGSILGPPYAEIGKPANLTITVTGSTPVSLTMGLDGRVPSTWQVIQPTTVVSLPINSLPTTFRLLNVRNECGPGTIQGNSVISLGLLTANEPLGLVVKVFPNPVSQTVFIENLPLVPLEVELWSTDGRLVRRKAFSSAKAISLSVMDLPTGVYLLRVSVNQATLTYRLLKS